jgi:sec-independent protein translocase protein TatB
MFPEGRAVEFLVAAVVALIVVGPKDLPILLRRFGQFMAKVRAMAAEFRASFDEMARQSELDELRKEVEAMRRGQLVDMSVHAPEVNQAFDDISQGLSDVGVQLNAPMAYSPALTQTEPVDVAIPPPAKPKRRAPKAPAKAPATRKAAAPDVAAAAPPTTKAAPTPGPEAKTAVKPPRKAAGAKSRNRRAAAS